MDGTPRFTAPVLVVEDDDALREQLADALRREGYGVVTAASGAEGVMRLCETPCPSVVVLDLNLPLQSGREFLHVKGQYLRWARIPVVALSCAPEAPAELAVEAVLPGPPDLGAVVAILRRFCPPQAA